MFEAIKREINEQEPRFLTAAKKGYVCPDCGNGSGSSGTGITKNPGDAHYHCFKCGLHADVIELYQKHSGITDFAEAVKDAAAFFGIAYTGEDTHTHTQQRTTNAAARFEDFTSFYGECAAHISETDYPQKRRGLSAEVCSRYNVGFCANWKPPEHPNAPATPRLIIPISNNTYLARDTRNPADIPEAQQKYTKYKVKNLDTGAMWIFNTEAIIRMYKPVFITEGEIDALSIIEVGGYATAIGSTANIKHFIEVLTKLKKNVPNMPLLVLALDNDSAGRAATEKLSKELDAINTRYVIYNPYGRCKDANEALTTDRAAFTAAVTAADNETTLKDTLYRANSAAAHLQAFVNGIHDSVNTPVTSTGFEKLDAALDGGLYEGLYIIGAISSLGKTTLVTQIADQIAKGGQDVLIFSLEMARAEIMAKSISRHTLQAALQSGGSTGLAKTARGITDGRRYAAYSVAERETIKAAIGEYSTYAEHIFIKEGIGDIGVNQIRQTIQQHISFTGKAPVVIVDYLQIIAPYSDKASDKQNTDKAVLELKRISRDHKTPVLAISSFNRANYKEAVTMAAFKESGAIEYSSDVLIGLQIEGAGGSGFDEQKAKNQNPRSIELVVLKNRNGKTGETVAFMYYTLFNYFEEQ